MSISDNNKIENISYFKICGLSSPFRHRSNTNVFENFLWRIFAKTCNSKGKCLTFDFNEMERLKS